MSQSTAMHRLLSACLATICPQCKACGEKNLGDSLEISWRVSEDFLKMCRWRLGWTSVPHLGYDG
jgi:hypothetical protein